MKVLLLGVPEPKIDFALNKAGDTGSWWDRKLNVSEVMGERFDFLVSYRYRYILREDILSQFPTRAINLHCSFLPWNRGADPNFWSFFDNTPKGVSIHHLDSGIDTGPVLVQKEIRFLEGESLKTSYGALQLLLLDLFENNWSSIRTGHLSAQNQEGVGTCHRLRDLDPHRALLGEKGWDTPVTVVENYGRRFRKGLARST